MSRVSVGASLLLVAVLLVVPYASTVVGDERQGAKDRKALVAQLANLERGMSSEQVRERLGAPERVARQILYHRYREQWIYDTLLPIRLTFECPRGQKPQLLSVPRLSVDKAPSRRGP